MPKIAVGPILALALAACGPQSAEPPVPNASETADASAAALAAEAEAPSPTPVAAPPRPAARPARRCGWLSNPTPANWWLIDADGQWILSTQGAEPAPGMEEMPDMSVAGWVETNGHYGYGCACMTLTADSEGRVTRIERAEPKPLKQCRADRKLPAPE